MTARQTRQITIAIHTYEHALSLKSLLEHEGISATLQNVNLQKPEVTAGVRVRISEDELPKALRIIENPDIFCHAGSETPSSPVVIAPVDFSPQSHRSCRLAFGIAAAHSAKVILIHAFMTPRMAMPRALSDALDFGDTADEQNPETQTETDRDVTDMMTEYAAVVRNEIKAGEMPAAPFETIVREGLPEEIILELAKDYAPLLIVMGTSGAGNKPRVMGSVTAEVLDSCRYPVFTVPDTSSPITLAGTGRVLFFTSPDQQDIVAIDAFLRLFAGHPLEITLINTPSKKDQSLSGKLLETLAGYCRIHYPDHSFKTRFITFDNLDSEAYKINASSDYDILGVPNKKKNLLARFFNPTLAHRLLFAADIPMLVIPV